MLTIYIPTFNRARQLEHVLLRLIDEIDCTLTLGGYVKIKIFNNCSTDETALVINSISRPYLFVYHRDENVGARANVFDAVNHCDTEFLWILGDDDLPMPGLLTSVVEFIREKKPNLLYLPAIWSADMLVNSSSNICGNLRFQEINAEEFVKFVGVKITFISSFVMNFEKYKSIGFFENNHDLYNTDFGHLSFYAPLLLTNYSLFVTDKVVISATGNSNFQYSLIRAFSVDLPFVFRRLFCSRPILYQIFIRNLIIAYIPSMVYAAKYKRIKCFEEVIPWPEILDSLGKNYFFWIFVWPIKYLPKFLCLPLIGIGRIFR